MPALCLKILTCLSLCVLLPCTSAFSCLDGMPVLVWVASLLLDLTIGTPLLSAGSWFSAGYHMGTTIAVPAAILPLPYAFSQLSWGPAIIALLLGTCTTYYSSWLLAGLFNWNGQTYYRYRDLVKSIYGMFPGFMNACMLSIPSETRSCSCSATVAKETCAFKYWEPHLKQAAAFAIVLKVPACNLRLDTLLAMWYALRA